jgi:hypothetical protein
LGKQRKECPSRRETEGGDYNQTVENNVAPTLIVLGVTEKHMDIVGVRSSPATYGLCFIIQPTLHIRSPRPKGNISSPARFLLAVLVEMTEV